MPEYSDTAVSVSSPDYIQPFVNLALRVMEPEFKDKSIPDRLHHYTNAAGLIGITEHHTLRFTDVNYLNDGSERSWGLGVINEALWSFMASKDDKERAFADEVYEKLKELSSGLRAAVFCMCAEENLLNQWRDYGNDVVPYCLSFDVQKLTHTIGYNFTPTLIEVVYDAASQQRIATNLVQALYDLISALRVADKITINTRPEIVRAAATQLLLVSYWFKNPGFAAEKEFRLALEIPNIIAANNTVKWRAGRYGLTPYFDWHSFNPNSRLPIVKAMAGPSNYPDITGDALQVFLRSMGYPHVEVATSTIPIRR